MNKLMIDFETLGVTSSPVLASLGAVVFNDEKIITSIYVKFNVEDCQQHGLEISASTFLWWLTQNENARLEMIDPSERMLLIDGMLLLRDLYQNYNCQEVYGNGALADIVWAKSAFNAVGINTPWTFREERCFRTLKAVLPNIEIDFQGTAHHPLDDAMWQSLYLIKALKAAK